jgi:hypothetical protein
MARKRTGRQKNGGSSGIPNAAKPVTQQNPLQNPYVSTAPPVDPQAEAYKVSAQRNAALGDADAGYQTARIENQYGLGSDRSNPYSDAKLLEDSYLRDQRGTTNSYAAQGQLYSGAYKRMKGENERQYSIGYDRLARSYQDAKYGVTRGQLQSYADFGSGVDDERFRSILRGLGG